MITSRRRAHLLLVAVITAVLPVVVAAGLIRRPGPIVTGDDSRALFKAAGFDDPSDPEGGPSDPGPELLAAGPLRLGVRSGESDAPPRQGFLALVVMPERALQQPDLLLYWAPGAAGPRLPGPQDQLIGELAGASRRRLPLEAATARSMARRPGVLLLFSQGKGRTIAAVPLPQALRRRLGGTAGPDAVPPSPLQP